MSIVLSASVRQNLLSLQSTASLLATTQNDLATGNKVNSALDNPTSFFTASALNNRASDIGNLLDGIGNGVQVLEAANTGITSLQSLVASAQSIANQVLQTPIGYSAKSSVVTRAIAGATANNLLGTPGSTSAPATGAVATATTAITTLNLTNTAAANATASSATAITTINLNNTPAANAAASAGTAITTIDLTSTAAGNATASATAGITTIDLTATPATNAAETATGTIPDTGTGIDATGGLSFDVNGQTVSLAAGGGTGASGTYLLSDIESAINAGVTGVTATDDGAGHLVLTSTGTAGALDAVAVGNFTGASFDGTSLGFAAAPATVNGTDAVTPSALSFDVNGQTVTLAAGSSYTGTDIASDIQSQVGTSAGVTASFASGKLVITSTGTAGATDNVTVNNFSSSDATQLGFAAATETDSGTAATTPSALSFKVNDQLVTLAAGSSYTGADIATAIQAQVGVSAGVTASFASGKLVITSTGTAGATDQVKLDTFSTGGATQLGFAAATETDNGAAAITATDLTFKVNDQIVTLAAGASYTGADIATAIQAQVGVSAGVTAAYTAGQLTITSTGTAGATDQVKIDTFSTGGATQLGFAAATETDNGAAANVATALTFNVNNQTVTLAAGSNYTGAQIASAINAQVGTSAAVNATVDGTGHLVISSTGTAGAADEVTVDTFSTGDATQLGFAAATETDTGTGGSTGLAGTTLTIGATGGGTATSIVFGTGTGQVSSLNELNTALAPNNLQATIDNIGVITLTTSNNAGSSTIGAIGGTATLTGFAFNGLVGGAPVVDPNAQATRAGLISQYNNVLKQIDTTSQDSSFNGINLLEGDTLNLTFDETGKSTLAIKGVTFNTAGLGLSTLVNGTDFLDSNSANAVLSSLTQVSTTLRSEASNLGSNLSIVQIRQDFSKNLINVLQTGASSLTLADTNEEAANSQALSTRQSIAVSALALANQSQQSVLQLLR